MLYIKCLYLHISFIHGKHADPQIHLIQNFSPLLIQIHIQHSVLKIDDLIFAFVNKHCRIKSSFSQAKISIFPIKYYFASHNVFS